jgi:hypothetical protein
LAVPLFASQNQPQILWTGEGDERLIEREEVVEKRDSPHAVLARWHASGDLEGGILLCNAILLNGEDCEL